MRRREFITFIMLGGSAAAAWPLAARAQQPAMPVIGFLSPSTQESFAHLMAAFRRGLKEAGFAEGENVAIEYRWANNDANQLSELAADLVRRRVTVIVTPVGTTAALAAKAATTTIPIVFSGGVDPVPAGLVASLRQPGGNVTGINYMSGELGAKRLGLLHELRPGAERFGLLVNPNNPVASEAVTKDVTAAATVIGRQIEVITAGSPRDIDTAFAAVVQKRADALLVGADPLFMTRRVQLATLATRHMMPAIYPWREFAEVGGLMSYGPSQADRFRQVGLYTGRILKGEKPRFNMKLPRRQFLQLAASAAALPAVSRIARAQAYPTRPVRLIEGFGAGSAPDIIARLMAQWLSERLGRPFVVENRSGANGNIATEAVARASPDGYMLLLVIATNAINATLYNRLNFDFVRDIAPVAIIGHTPLVMEVHPSVPAKTVPDFIAYAKANPGKINMGSAGTGNATHVCGELFKMMTGVNLFHVPYRGAQVFPALLAGEVQVYFGIMGSSIEYIRAGKVRALAVTTATRSAALPDIPTVGESVAGYESSGYFGFGAPAGTPAGIIDKLNKEVNAGLADPKLKTQLADLGGIILGGSSADFRALITEETEKWGKVIRAANIKV